MNSVDVLGDVTPVVLAFDEPSGVAPSLTSVGLVGGRLDDGFCEFGLVVRCHPPAVRLSRVVLTNDRGPPESVAITGSPQAMASR